MLRKLREARDDEGFTLIELLVVVIIIGILAAIAIPVFLNQRERAYVSAAESDARNAAVQVESYFAETDGYPTTSLTWTTGVNTLGAQDVAVSDNVELTYTPVGTPPTAYTIEADHALVDGTGTFEATYDSAAGGIQ